MKKISKSLLNWLPAITLGIVLGSFLQLTQAWQEPGSNPPDSNIGAPVTTGSASQYKSGALGVNGLLRGYGKVMGNELCFGWDCRSDWQDLYKSGDKVCIESGNCVDVADNYIGDSGTHYAGGDLNMRNNNITNTNRVYASIFYDDDNTSRRIDPAGTSYVHRLRSYYNGGMPTYAYDVATKKYVDNKVADAGGGSLSGCYWTGWTSSPSGHHASDYRYRLKCDTDEVMNGMQCGCWLDDKGNWGHCDYDDHSWPKCRAYCCDLN